MQYEEPQWCPAMTTHPSGQVTSRGSVPPGDMPQPDVNVPTGSFTAKWYGE